MIAIANRALDQLWDSRLDWAVRQVVDRLLNDSARLSHFFHAHQVSIIRVAVIAQRHVEVHVRVSGIWSRLAYVPGNARTAQCWARQTDRDRLFARNHPDAHRAA